MNNKYKLFFLIIIIAHYCQAQGKIYLINETNENTQDYKRKEIVLEYFEIHDLIQILDSLPSNYDVVIIEDDNIRKLPKGIILKINAKFLQVITPNLKSVGKYYGDNPNIQTYEIYSDRINFVSMQLYKSNSPGAINLVVKKFSTFARMAVKFNKKHINDYNINFELYTQEAE